MRGRRSFIAMFAASLFASCAPVEAPAQPSNADPVVITLSRTVCFGFCPAYTVTITGEGQVRYVGNQFVNVVGERTATIPAADVQRLLARFDEIGFEQLDDAYRAPVTDLPTITILLERDGRRKVVADYGGVSAGMPRAVRDLQAEIDRAAGTAQWVLRDGQPVRTRPEP